MCICSIENSVLLINQHVFSAKSQEDDIFHEIPLKKKKMFQLFHRNKSLCIPMIIPSHLLSPQSQFPFIFPRHTCLELQGESQWLDTADIIFCFYLSGANNLNNVSTVLQIDMFKPKLELILSVFICVQGRTTQQTRTANSSMCRNSKGTQVL